MTNAHHAQSANSRATCIVRAMGAWVGSCAVACVVNTTHAETYEVKPGDDWAALGPKLVAGDEIVLLEGMHRPAQFSAIAGTREKPIVIRSIAKNKLAEIGPDREGLKLTDCAHVRVERLLIKNARRAGVVIDSTVEGASHDIDIRDVLVIGVAGLVEQAGILAIDTDRLEIRRSRFENCRGAALHLEQTNELTVELVQIKSDLKDGSAYGVLIVGECNGLAFNDVWIAGSIQTGASIGARDASRHVSAGPAVPTFPELRTPLNPTAPAPAPVPVPSTPEDPVSSTPPSTRESGAKLPPLVHNATFENLLVRGADCAFEFGSCDGVTITSSTIVNPSEEVFRFTVAPTDHSGAAVRFRNNIVCWMPGGLRRFNSVAEGADSAGLLLGPNIWWSNELPSALPLLGPAANPFLGTLEVPQTINLDPDLDDRNRPLRSEAKLYGRKSS
ncbi:MAG: right-handed parallel beta-helix repeat-containing protein [Planctomycetota bacterium]